MRVLLLDGGPAVATAALQARELGADVTLVEAKRVRLVRPRRTGSSARHDQASDNPPNHHANKPTPASLPV